VKANKPLLEALGLGEGEVVGIYCYEVAHHLKEAHGLWAV
jgi:hypothetical protein